MWEQAGANAPLTSGHIAGCPQWMSLTSELKGHKKSKKQTTEIVSAYHLDSRKTYDEINKFYEHYNEYLEKKRKGSNIIIIGADTICPLGVANEDDLTKNSQVIGQHTDPYNCNNETL